MAGDAGHLAVLQWKVRRHPGYFIHGWLNINRVDVIFGRAVVAPAQLFKVTAVSQKISAALYGGLLMANRTEFAGKMEIRLGCYGRSDGQGLIVVAVFCKYWMADGKKQEKYLDDHGGYDKLYHRSAWFLKR